MEVAFGIFVGSDAGRVCCNILYAVWCFEDSCPYMKLLLQTFKLAQVVSVVVQYLHSPGLELGTDLSCLPPDINLACTETKPCPNLTTETSLKRTHLNYVNGGAKQRSFYRARLDGEWIWKIQDAEGLSKEKKTKKEGHQVPE